VTPHVPGACWCTTLRDWEGRRDHCPGGRGWPVYFPGLVLSVCMRNALCMCSGWLRCSAKATSQPAGSQLAMSISYTRNMGNTRVG
jgi:hypothetical protein